MSPHPASSTAVITSPASPEVSDEALMVAYQQGDSAAFEQLYSRVSGRVFGYLKKRLKEPHNGSGEAEEVLQQVFMKFHQSRQQYLPKFPLQAWLFTVTRTTLMDHLRKKKGEIRDRVDLSPQELEEIPTDSRIADQGLSESQQTQLQQALSKEQGQIVEWRVIDELSYEEISRRLDKTESSIRKSLSRSLQKLKGMRWSND